MATSLRGMSSPDLNLIPKNESGSTNLHQLEQEQLTSISLEASAVTEAHHILVL